MYRLEWASTVVFCLKQDVCSAYPVLVPVCSLVKPCSDYTDLTLVGVRSGGGWRTADLPGLRLTGVTAEGGEADPGPTCPAAPSCFSSSQVFSAHQSHPAAQSWAGPRDKLCPAHSREGAGRS